MFHPTRNKGAKVGGTFERLREARQILALKKWLRVLEKFSCNHQQTKRHDSNMSSKDKTEDNIPLVAVKPHKSSYFRTTSCFEEPEVSLLLINPDFITNHSFFRILP